MTQNRGKKSKIIFGSELSEANNEPIFRIHQKNDKKFRKNIFLGQNFLERIMSQLLDNTKKMTYRGKKSKKKIFWLKIV